MFSHEMLIDRYLVGDLVKFCRKFVCGDGEGMPYTVLMTDVRAKHDGRKRAFTDAIVWIKQAPQLADLTYDDGRMLILRAYLYAEELYAAMQDRLTNVPSVPADKDPYRGEYIEGYREGIHYVLQMIEAAPKTTAQEIMTRKPL